MSTLRRAALLLALGIASSARAESAVPVVYASADVPVVRSELEPAAPSLPHLGLSLAAGVPSGASAELLFRPWRALRLHAGAAYDVVSEGVLGGVTLVPFRAVVAPVLSLELGKLFEGDASRFASGQIDAAHSAFLQHVGYAFATAELGLEIGAPDAFVFTLRAGLAGIQTTVHQVGNSFLGGTGNTAADAQIHAVIPSARLGFTFFI